ncbi:hypothetical protein [Dyella sp. A6]|uniref:hypothetical protein n=1 Tax=Dyella aluminiiresistens TaxID=3069105 RepID=UPI002E78F448|nr:hypothetical protein [Dyella sp. A6]
MKGLFRWYFKQSGETANIEERVVLFYAKSFDHAFELAEAEARGYCADDPSANFCIEPIGHWNACWLGHEPKNGSEVFSRLCKTTLDSAAFVRRYYPKSHEQAANNSSKRIR